MVEPNISTSDNKNNLSLVVVILVDSLPSDVNLLTGLITDHRATD